MKCRLYIGGALLDVLIAGAALAANAPLLQPGMDYQEVKTWHEQFLLGEPTRAQRLDAMREIVKTSRLGDRGLHQIFGNFEGRHSIDPRIPGVEQSILFQMSANKSQAKGYRREVRYATALHSDPRFVVLEMNRKLVNTDADIVFRHRASGLFGRMEVKDVSLDSQSTNFRKLKTQIDKMAAHGRRTGHLQFWINRREVHPRIRDYAQRKGIFVLGGVSTGRSLRNGMVSSGEALNRFDRRFASTGHASAITAGGQFAFGLPMLLNAAPAMWADTQSVLDFENRTTQAWLRLGEHSSSALGGLGMTIAGTARMAGRYSPEGLNGRLYSVGRWGGIAGGASFVAGELFLVSRYATGDVTSREFRTEQWVLGTTGFGSMAGSWVGAATGIALLKNPTSLSAVGGTAGAFIGQEVGRRSAQKYYDAKYAALDQRFGQAVYEHYGVH